MIIIIIKCTGTSVPAKRSKHFPIQKQLSEQEEIDLLISSVCDEVQLDAEDEFDFLENVDSRIAELKLPKKTRSKKKKEQKSRDGTEGI